MGALSVAHQGAATCYLYGADGGRLMKVEGLPQGSDCTALPGAAARTAYIGPLEVRALGQAGQVVMAYPAGAVRLTAANNTWAPAFLHKDHLGSVRAISGPDGTPEERTLYRPYGGQTEVATATLNDDKSWLGERYDAGAGLQYLNARYYDPELAIFYQPDWFDPTDPMVGTNRYAYGLGNPIGYRDPTGNRNDNEGDHGNVDETGGRGAPAGGGARGSVHGGAGSDPYGSSSHDGDDDDDDGGWFWPSTTTNGAGEAVYRSGAIFRFLVPGQVAWDNAVSAGANGHWGEAALSGGLMVGEIGVTVYSLGAGRAAMSASRGAANAAAGATDDIVGAGTAAKAVVETTNVTAQASRHANLAVNLGSTEFQSTLLSNGYKVVRQTIGTNGPVSVLSNGSKTYTIYTSTSTGQISAQVTNSAGEILSKIRLTGP